MFCEVHYSTYYRKLKKKIEKKGQRSKVKKKKFYKIKDILIISVYCYLSVYACVNVQL